VRLRIGMALAMAMVCSWATWIYGGMDGSSLDGAQAKLRTGYADTSPNKGESGDPQRLMPVRKPLILAERADTSRPVRLAAEKAPAGAAASASDTHGVALPDTGEFHLLSRDPLDLLRLENIKPLYTSPAMPGEGVWETSGCPRDTQGRPLVYKTFYRPSVAFPNAMVFVMVVDMSRVDLQYYVGSQEPAARLAASTVDAENRRHIMAFTNAMWMQRHSKGAGAIFRGKELYPMVDGMATLIVYKDGSVDVREWSRDIPVHMVSDARQLLHLIVKDGMVVQTVQKGKRTEDAEIGLGFLLGGGGKDADGNHFWYVAHRSAFGVRNDGNLVFAIGHHIGSKDLAKAMVLAGCTRAMHADANPDNIVGNLYIRDSFGNLVQKVKLSPEQSKYSLNRYEKAYTKDFFAFFLKGTINPSQPALTRRNETPVRRNQ
jgi:hypothetical protein